MSAGYVGILVGLLFGFIVAATICGTLATLILIENHLRNLLESDLRQWHVSRDQH
ncbi:hypothetical protein [Mesorhizobium sp. LNJC394B00]|uniref:hypothetical protein n=1 Tax=Mesorhizobium sp. LNJC394B00 TaxID=1287274 RepID=UPI0003CE676B|nr:hypothetical protein [Mesorhizobium sp. LNJC394B00]ESY21420.1 hypothetical protein X750_16815 [Mesorhizobium sp. LNJC394B00]